MAEYIRVVRKNQKKDEENQVEMKEHYEILDALSRDYLDVYIIDPYNNLSISVKSNGVILEKKKRISRPYDKTWAGYIKKAIVPEEQEKMLAMVEIKNVMKHLNQNRDFLYEFESFVNNERHYYQMRYLFVGNDENTTVILGFKLVDDFIHAEQKRRRELEEALEAAQQANGAKTTFLNSMSHDIRTPMNAILGFAELMERDIDNPEKIKNYLKKIKASGDYLLTLINNVLEVARIDSGKEELDENFVDLKSDKCSVVPLLESEISKKKLIFTCSMNIQHRYVFLDLRKIREITMNLMSNAIKYTPEGGTINMEFIELPCEKEGYATYKNIISDNGVGMTKGFQEKIFESFSRERDTTESKISGSGLGMAIVKKLVDMMGGTIEVESEPGKGSTFKVIISHRIAQNPEQYLEENFKENPENSINLKGKRVLLAEDNELNAEIATAILAEFGLEVELASDGIQCVDMVTKLSERHYDLILMDIQMPNLNGYDATKKIRGFGKPEIANIPIIAMTANAFEEDRKLAAEAGMNGHISKPIELSKLQALLTELLK